MDKPSRCEKWIAIAVGDPNGIGPEIAIKAANYFCRSRVGIVVVGDKEVLRHYHREHASELEFAEFTPGQQHNDQTYYWDVPALAPEDFQPGCVGAASGYATVKYVEEALRLAQANVVDAVVGCPHSEQAVHDAGIAFAGYPGLVARLTGRNESEGILMLSARWLNITHVTLHQGLKEALENLTVERVVQAGLKTELMMRRLGVESAKLALFGINPHAGENGLFGDDDEKITIPAAEILRSKGVDIEGPAGADVLLSQRRHDAYIAMYHDQGHIPIKLISPLWSSAITLGVPVLFSSVGHGCAPDIAGQGVAQPQAVIETVKLLSGLRLTDSRTPQ